MLYRNVKVVDEDDNLIAEVDVEASSIAEAQTKAAKATVKKLMGIDGDIEIDLGG